MDITRATDIDPTLAAWNDQMYRKHPTPYGGLVGLTQKLRVRKVLKFSGVQPTERVIEIGCESGKLLIRVPKCKRLVGTDISLCALEDARDLFDRSGRSAEFYQVDAQKSLPFRRGEFDVVICSEMLEHVGDPLAVLKNIHAISSVDSRIVVTIPIQSRKDRAAKILKATGLFGRLLPGIEEGQSEWHLNSFSKEDLHALVNNLFVVTRAQSVSLYHYVALMAPNQ